MGSITAVGTALASTTNAATYACASFTPTAGRLMFAWVGVTDATPATPTLTDTLNNNGLTFTLVDKSHKINTGSSTQVGELYLFVANQLTPGSPAAMTLTISGVTGASGCVIMPGEVAGMTRVGTSAIRQSNHVDDTQGGTAPAVVFGSNALTGNPTAYGALVSVGTGTTPPASMIERADVTYATPTTGGEWSSRDSGFTGTTLTLGSGSNGPSAAIAVEFDTSSVLTSVTSTRATTWDVLAPVSSTRATTWDVLAPVSSTRVTTWNVLTSTTSTRAATWDVRAVITSTRATTWNVRAAVTSLRVASWNVLTSLSSTRATTWNVLAALSSSRSTTWVVRAAVTSTRATTWDVSGPVTSTRSTTWNVRVAITSTRATTWAVLAAVTSTRATTWDVAAPLVIVTSTRSTSWNVLAAVTSSRATTWDVRAFITSTRDTTWTVLAAVTSTRTALWAVLFTITSTRSTTWDVFAPPPGEPVDVLVLRLAVSFWSAQLDPSEARVLSIDPRTAVLSTDLSLAGA